MPSLKLVWMCLFAAAQLLSASVASASPPLGPNPPATRPDGLTPTTTPLAAEPEARDSLGEGKDVGPCGHARAWAKLIDAERGGPDGPGGPREGDNETDVTHYFLDITIIPEPPGSTTTAVRVQGISTITAQPTIGPLTTFTVDLAGNMTASAVTGNVNSWSRVGDTVVITLDRSYAIGEQFQVAVTYTGYPSPPPGTFGVFAWSLRYGNLCVGTLSEPFFAKYWWPCKDSLNDKATMQMHCTVPNGMVVASNGALEGVDAVGLTQTKYRWREDYPMVTYLASLAITNYQRYDITFNYNDGSPHTMPVWCYLYPDHWDFANSRPYQAYKDGCDELLAMLDKLGIRFGLYPFVAEKYGVAEMDNLSAYMEHQTCTTMIRVDSVSDTMCHELSHQWWGDEVTCETWYDIWLNEGFASYAEPLYRELKVGGGFSSYIARVRGRRPGNPDAQVYRTDISSSNAIFSTNDVYNKGCWVLHMLRHVMGDTAFFQALADYRAAYHDNSATTAEFAASFSASFGHNLSWFTDEWVMHPGSPRYEYAWRAAQSGSQNYLQLQIAQTLGGGAPGYFTMPIDIAVTTNSGTTTYVVWSLHATDRFAIPTNGVPTAVAFDPDPGSGTTPPTRWVLAKSLAQVSWPSPGPTVHCQGDMNEDGAVNGLDIQPFVNALLDASSYPLAWQRGDMNFDGVFDLTDVPLFVAAMLSPSPCPAS